MGMGKWFRVPPSFDYAEGLMFGVELVLLGTPEGM